MKIILSHDVDHLCLLEHCRDTFIPGLLQRTILAASRGELSLGEAVRRFSLRLNNIDELATFNADRGLPQTFFFGMASGLNLSYRPKSAAPLIRSLVDMGVEVGIHGMAYQSQSAMLSEKERLAEILGYSPRFIRNHYLRTADQTHSIMANLGYAADSSIEALMQPWNVNRMWVLPISLMDASLLRRAGTQHPELQAMARSALTEAESKGLPYFVVNFHDLYFSGGYPVLKRWYRDFISEMLDIGYEFCSFHEAVQELRSKLPTSASHSLNQPTP